MKLSFAQRIELAETGTTKVFVPPHRLPDDEVTWGHWITVARHRGKIVEVIEKGEVA